MERQAKDGTFYKQVGEDQWEPITRTAKDGTVYKKMGTDSWEPLQAESSDQSEKPFSVSDIPPEYAQAKKDFLNFGPVPTAEGLTRSTIKSLPQAGGMAGAALGFLSPVPGGTMIGAGGGAVAGTYLKNLIEQYLLGDEKSSPEIHTEAFKTGLLNAITEGGSSILGRQTPEALTKLGKKIYKTGTGAIDALSHVKGKTPVSEDLIEAGVWGGAASIETQANKLAEDLLKQRDAILKGATKEGVEVSMKDAMAPARAKIAELRSLGGTDNLRVADAFEKRVRALERQDPVKPQQIIVADAFEKRVRPLKRQDPVKPQQIITELSQQGEFRGAQPGDVDYVPPTRGTLPIQGTVIPPTFKQGSQIGVLKTPTNYVELPTQAEPLSESINYTGETSFRTPVTTKYQQAPVGASAVSESVPVYAPPTRTPEMMQTREVPTTFESPLNESTRFYQKPGKSILMDVPGRPGVTPIKATKLKTSVGNTLPSSKFGVAAQTSEGQKLLGKIREGLQKTTEKSLVGRVETRNPLAPEAEPIIIADDGLSFTPKQEPTFPAPPQKINENLYGDQLGEINAKLGRLLTVRRKLSQDAGKEVGGRIVSGKDIAAAALSPKALLMKKIWDMTGTAGPTGFGLGMYKAGKALQKIGSPWDRMVIELNKLGVDSAAQEE
jgi:hypothetical protein